MNLKAGGVLTVALLSSESLDATRVHAATIAAGPGRAREAHGRVHAEDVNGDGLVDAVLHFRIRDLGLSPETRVLEVWASAAGADLRGAAPVSVK